MIDLERIVISAGLRDYLVDLSNKDNELMGYFIAERTPRGLVLSEGCFEEGGVLDASHLSSEDLKKFRRQISAYVQFVREIPSFVLIGGHIHSTRFGVRIPRDSPYWSVNAKNTKHPPNSIVDNRFYISNRGGDDDAFEQDYKKYGVAHHLFIHPVFGSEGTIMSPEKVSLTHFGYDVSKLGKVRELDCEIIEGRT